ncbi:MAG: hypothetical protein ACOYBJ_01405 [Patescibacteria group bacterium]
MPPRPTIQPDVPFSWGPRFVLALATLVLAGAAFLVWRAFDLLAVRSYAECVNAPGVLIRETYPAQCVLPSGQTFVQPLEGGR